MLSLLIISVYAGTVKNYAVIMCGSKGWSNYRHQADVYAWRTVLINRGFLPENIITLSYDDVPEQNNNTIYHTCYGPNLYKENVINYTKSDANKDNFFKVLSTIPSGKGGFLKDIVEVLVIYINHGAYDMLSTPNSFDQPIYSDDFSKAVNELASRVSRVFCIIEACYSGTIAMHSRYARNVMFITAANAKQSSYSYGYCARLGVFTSNEMTYHVLNYLDNIDNDKRYLDDMILYVRHNTNLSNVIRSGLTKRIKLKELFKTIGKHGINNSLGNVTVTMNRKRRNVNTLTNEELLIIYNRIRRTLVANIEPIKQDRLTEIRCRKRITATALQLFVNDYLHEDNIDFLNMIGDLCNDFAFIDISQVMSSVRSVNIHAHYHGRMHR